MSADALAASIRPLPTLLLRKERVASKRFIRSAYRRISDTAPSPVAALTSRRTDGGVTTLGVMCGINARGSGRGASTPNMFCRWVVTARHGAA